MSTTLDFTEYVRAPRINAATGVVLSIRLIRAVPPDPTPAELVALSEVRDAAKLVQDSVGARHRSIGSNLRPLGQRFNGAWAGFNGRLVSWTRLINRPESHRATDMVTSLFPHGLQFLLSGYEVGWFHSRMLLARIQNEELVDELVELASEPFLSELQLSHAALGEGLGLDENTKSESSTGPGLGELVAALAEAIGRYGRVLSGTVNVLDAASRSRFMSAVAPVDAHRARNRRGSGSTEELVADADVEEPLDIDSPIPTIEGE